MITALRRRDKKNQFLKEHVCVQVACMHIKCSNMRREAGDLDPSLRHGRLGWVGGVTGTMRE